MEEVSDLIGDASVAKMEATQHRHRSDSARLRKVFLVELSGDVLTDALMRSGLIT